MTIEEVWKHITILKKNYRQFGIKCSVSVFAVCFNTSRYYIERIGWV